MDKNLTIVRYAFQICFIYFLKCLMPPVHLSSSIRMFGERDLDKELNEHINNLRDALLEPDNRIVNKSNNRELICSNNDIIPNTKIGRAHV